MSMASLTANLDRGTHHEAQAAQKAAMAAFADHHVHPAVAGDKKSLHRAATIKRGPDDEPVTAAATSRRWPRARGSVPTTCRSRRMRTTG
jgi:hypothetical protein